MIILMIGVVWAIYPLTLVGATGVGLMVAWHGLYLLQQMRQALPAYLNDLLLRGGNVAPAGGGSLWRDSCP